MYWDDLNKDNIEQVKDLYADYLLAHKNNEYESNLKTFEEYLEDEVVKCPMCQTPTTRDRYDFSRDGYLCECCYEDLYGEHEDDVYQQYVDYKLEGGYDDEDSN